MAKPKSKFYFMYRSAVTGRFISRLKATPATKREWVRERRLRQEEVSNAT